MAKILILCALICSLGFSTNITQAKNPGREAATEKQLYDPEMNCTSRVNYTEAQQKQLEQIYKRIYRDYSDLIDVYSKWGALSPYQTKLRHLMLNNYINTFYKRNYRWCSEHESDEWEEEWYNHDDD